MTYVIASSAINCKDSQVLDFNGSCPSDTPIEIDDFSFLLGGDEAPSPEMSNCDVALDLARRGFAVFPVRFRPADGDDDAHWAPAFKAYADKATTAADIIRKWWTRWPTAAIGLPCGERNAVTVMDLDRKKGVDGVASLAELGFADLAATSPVRVRTPSGGYHLFFRYEPRVKNWVRKIGAGIDIRTGGGYVIAPGSWKGDSRYVPEGSILGDIDLPPFPESLIPPTEPEREPVETVVATPELIHWANEKLRSLVAELAAQTEARNDTLNRHAMWAGGAGAHGFLQEDVAREALSTAAADAGLKPREIRSTFDSGWKAGLRKPLSDFPRDFEETGDDFEDLDTDPRERVDDSFEHLLGGDDDKPTDGTETQPKGHPKLHELNDRCAVVMVGSKALIASMPPETDRLDLWQTPAFHTFFANDRIKIIDPRTKKPKTVAVSEAWLQWPERRTYAGGIPFAPEGTSDDTINLWRGWGVEPDADATCDLFLAHLRDVICSGDVSHFEYLVGWLAHLVQHPADKPGVAVVLRGAKGAGKDAMGRYLARMIGRRHVASIAQENHITGRFNNHFEAALLIHVEEALWAGSKQGESVLKNLLTAPTLTIERKGVDAYQARTSFRMLMSSNEDWAVPASADERRFAVFDVSDRRRGDADYFVQLHHEMESDGPAALLHFLKNYDLAGFNVRRPPETAGLRDQKVASLRGVEQWWFATLFRGTLSSGFGDSGDWDAAEQVIGREALRAAYVEWSSKQRYGGSPINDVLFGRRLREMMPGLQDRRGRDGQLRVWQYRVPKLTDCRDSFDAWLQSPVEWPM